MAKGQDPRNCHRLWTLGPPWSLKSVNGHTDCVAKGQDPRICRRCWTLGPSWSLKSVSGHRDRGQGWDPRVCRCLFQPSEP